MAIRFIDSFSVYDTAHLFAKWTTTTDSNGSKTIIPGSGRCLQNCLQLIQTTVGTCWGPIWHVPTAGLTKGTMGVGFRVTANPLASEISIFSVLKDGALDNFRQVSVVMFTNGTVGFMRGYNSAGGGYTELARSTQAINDLSWHQFVWTFDVKLAGGSMSLYVDGNPVPWVTFNGITAFQAASGYTDIQLGAVGGPSGVSGGTAQFSDFYYGDVDTDNKGDCRVFGRVPNADGTYKQWIVKSGVLHYAMVNDNPPDDNVTYNSSVTVANRDTYLFPAIGIPSGTVYAVQLSALMQKSDVGYRSMAPVIVQGGVTYDGTIQTLANGTYLYYMQLYELDPTGSAWTVSTASNDEFGVKLAG